VERAYEKNGMPATLIAHSLGCQIAHRFITEKTTSEWRRKYVNTTILVAPSWSGSGASFNTLWRIQAPVLKFLELNQLTDFAQSLGTLHIHMPHFMGYANTTLFVDPNGQQYSADELMNILIKYQKLKPRHVLMAENNIQYIRKWPSEPDGNVKILYNSGRKTALGLNLTNWRGFGRQIYGDGDGLVGSAVIDWVCDHWKGLVCHDLKSPERKHYHTNLIISDDAIEIVLRWAIGITNETKKVTGDGEDEPIWETAL
jgi:hypothetical protein